MMDSPGTDLKAGAALPVRQSCMLRFGLNAWAPACLVALVLLLVPGSPSAASTGGLLEIKNGYFWDPVAADYFIPRGFAYQTFNPPVGASQTFEQLEYDLTEFKKLHANSVRAELVWNMVETAPGSYDWSKPDFLVAKAQALKLRLFLLIGFQYAPSWFPDEWKAVNSTNGISVVLNYEHPQARLAYSNFIFSVTSRYKDSAAVAAWVLGNEYAYFDLWNPDHRYLGFDPYSLGSYHQFLTSRYGGSIAALNATWGSNYTSFAEIPMFLQYPLDGKSAGYHDLTLWREYSIGQYVAVGAQAAALADPNHLRTYSMIGGLFMGNDANYTCEDARTIVGACAKAAAPLHFWSINNYTWATTSAEMRSVDFGLAKHLATSGLPVLVSETGNSTTDDLNAGSAPRQPKAVLSDVWESFMSGAMGVHIFTWNDRDLFNGVFLRERGFGVVQQDRLPKPAYTNVAGAFAQMENLHLEHLLPGSSGPRPDIALFWSKAAELGWPRANQENATLWGALKRLGYQLTVVDDQLFALDAYTNASALLLSRCSQMNPADLERVVTNAVARGIHVHANADLPGQFDAYSHPNADWPARMNSLFGLNVAKAYPGLDTGEISTLYDQLFLRGVSTLGPLTNGFTDHAYTWRIWHRITASSGVTIATHTGTNGSQPAMPALQIRDLGTARSAINTFALGDLWNQSASPLHDWDLRYNWLQAVYSNHFGLSPIVKLSGVGAGYVKADYRFCANGSVLLSLLNEVADSASVTLASPELLAGKTVENLTTGGLIATTPDGIHLDLAGDDYVLLYVYSSTGGVDQSLLNPSLNKLWIAASPPAVWPKGSNYAFTVGYDVRDPGLTLMASFERVLYPNLVYALTNLGGITGPGSLAVPLLIPDADLHDPWYISSREGGDYVFHVWLVKNGSSMADAYMPVRLLWAVRPLSLPAAVKAGGAYSVAVEWQELPAWLPSEGSVPLDRPRLWQPYLASQQYYKVVLQLLSAGQVVVSQEFLTNIGTGQHTFSVVAPQDATGPFSWSAHLQTAPQASVDMVDSFEDRDTGADPDLFAPWQLFIYAETNAVVPQMFLAAGIDTDSSDGTRAIFAVVTNAPTVGNYSGFALSYTYPQSWALPRESVEWTNYTFAFDFKEAAGLPCVLEMQLQDTRGGQIHFTNAYSPGPGGWCTLSASLSDFVSPPWVGSFDSEHVNGLIVNVQMQQTGVTYQGSIDNVRFFGPKTLEQTVAPLDIWDGFEDRSYANGSNGWAALAPWSTYVYPGPGTRELDRGIAATQGLGGGQAAFMVVTNPADIGPISGFGLYRNFDKTWSLPNDTNAWADYVLSYHFREASGLPCSVEMQVKSGAANWIEFRKPYDARAPGGWDYVSASLAEFVQPDGISGFDPKNVQAIALNIRVLQTNAMYVGFFDNVYLEAPALFFPTGTRFGQYQGAADAAPNDTPFRIESVEYKDGQILLSWLARTDFVYTVEYQDGGFPFGQGFLPLRPLTDLTVTVNGLVQVADTNAPSSLARLYRVRFQPR